MYESAVGNTLLTDTDRKTFQQNKDFRFHGKLLLRLRGWFSSIHVIIDYSCEA